MEDEKETKLIYGLLRFHNTRVKNLIGPEGNWTEEELKMNNEAH